MPVTKTVNDALMGATVVREGTVFLRVTSTGKDTVLSQIVNMIEDAQASKPPIQVLHKIASPLIPGSLPRAWLPKFRKGGGFSMVLDFVYCACQMQAMADAISQVFVPVIVCFSLAVFSGWLIAANLDMVPAAWIGNRTPLAFALNMGRNQQAWIDVAMQLPPLPSPRGPTGAFDCDSLLPQHRHSDHGCRLPLRDGPGCPHGGDGGDGGGCKERCAHQGGRGH